MGSLRLPHLHHRREDVQHRRQLGERQGRAKKGQRARVREQQLQRARRVVHEERSSRQWRLDQGQWPDEGSAAEWPEEAVERSEWLQRIREWFRQGQRCQVDEQ